MPQSEQQHSPNAKPDFLTELGNFAKNLFGLLVSRLELASIELSEIRINFLKVLFFSALGFMAFWFALIFWTILIVLLTWPLLGWKVLLIMAAIFTGLFVKICWHVKIMINRVNLTMPMTIQELRNDRDALF